MVKDLMTLRDLRVQTFKERIEGDLTLLPADFYHRTQALENKIRDVIENSKEDPKRFEKANNDIRKLLDMKLELHKSRERKITNLAREKINGQNPDTANVHANERDYLLSLCEVIETYRKKTLVNEVVYHNKPKKSKNEKLPEKEPEIYVKQKTKKNKKNVGKEYIKVEILEDLPTFIGMDAKNYTLKNNNIEIIPIYNARILRDAGKVKIIKEVKA